MAIDAGQEGARRRLLAIAAALSIACAEADALDAHLLAAKIEDSRICAEDMLQALSD